MKGYLRSSLFSLDFATARTASQGRPAQGGMREWAELYKPLGDAQGKGHREEQRGA